MATPIKKPTEPAFPEIDFAAWETAASKELKGAEPLKALSKRWPDNLDIRPVYSQVEAITSEEKRKVSEPTTWVRVNAKQLESLVKQWSISKIRPTENELKSVFPAEDVPEPLLKEAENMGISVLDRHLSFQILEWSNGKPEFRDLAHIGGQQRVIINLAMAHNIGATPTMELALAKLALDQLESLRFSGQVTIESGVSPQVMLETAKLTALGELSVRSNLTIRAVNPVCYLQSKDPWTNQLRNVSAGLTALLGGADEFVPVIPTDIPNDENGLVPFRTAALTLTILRHEGKLGGVSRPLAGSGAEAALTHELLNKTRLLLQSLPAQFEDKIIAIGKMISESGNQRKIDFERQFLTLTGINKFSTGAFEVRLTLMPFEQKIALAFPLERAFEDNKRKMMRLAIFGSGDVKWQRTRIDFCRNFFDALGIETENYSEDSNGPVVWCADDVTYTADFQQFREKMKRRPIIIAGNPTKLDAALASAGFLFVYNGKSLLQMNEELRNLGK